MVYAPDAETRFENTFKVTPVNNSATDFIITDLGLDGSTSWYGTYDSSSKKFTVGGVEVGYEDDGNYFGKLWGYWDQAQTQGFGFYSLADENSEGNDPCVFTVDATSHQISSIDVLFAIPVFDLTSGSLLGYAGYFPWDTPVTLVSSYNTSSAPATVRPLRVPFSSVLVPNTPSNTLRTRYAAKTCEEAVQFAPGVRTLDITTKKCEPLPKQFSGLKIKDSARGGLK